MNRTFRAATVCGVCALLTVLAVPASRVSAQTPAPTGVTGQATWDARYLYLRLVVADPDVLGTNTLPLSEPQKDDSVAVYVQTGDAKPDAPNAQTHAMLVSAAGGFTFLAGDDTTKTLAPKPVFSIKYGVSVQGTLNRSGDTDSGYTVELAIPWSELGVADGAIKSGTPFAINVVVRDRSGKSFSSLAPGVATETDLLTPAKWLPLLLTDSESADAPTGSVFAPPVPVKDKKKVPPTIDGVTRAAGEWPAVGQFAFVAPTTTTAPTAPVDAPTKAVAVPEDNTPPALTLTAETLSGVEPSVFARYRLDIQGDGRKIAPFGGTFDERTGKFLLADAPLTGAGTWFSADRASWHRGLLYEMRRTGVDVALVSVGKNDTKALYVLVEALREMTQDGLPTPKIALEFNTDSLIVDNAPLDLSPGDTAASGAARETLYNAVRTFFAIVPPQFRARVTLPVSAGGVPVYPVFFAGTGLKNATGTDWTDDLRIRFAAEFGAASGGAGLVFVGDTNFDAQKSPGLLAGGVPLQTGGAGNGTLPVYVVQPGIEADGKLVSRKNGDTYAAAWQAAFAVKPKWYILDSWNDFGRGTELVASRQYGTRYLDATRIFAVQTGNLGGIDLRWRGTNMPRRMRVGQTAPVQVTVQNAGGTALRAEDGYALGYRWKQNGVVVAEAPLRNRLSQAFLPTQTKEFLLGVTSFAENGTGRLAPLPPGDYSLEIDFLKLKSIADIGGAGDYLAQTGVAPLVVPVSLYADNRQVALFESTSTPAMLQSGATYPVTVTVRYMGGDDLPVGAAALTWQLVTADNKTVVATGSSPVRDLLPSGVAVPVLATVSLNDPSGLPVSPAFPELPEGRGVPGGGYRLRWLLTRTDSTDAVPGELVEQVAVYAGDEEARFPLPQNVPESVGAGATFTLNVPVINRGTATWKADEYRVGAHWYFADGLEAQWKPSVTAPLPKDVAPGEEVIVKLPIHAPDTEGSYVVVPDVARLPDDFLSTRPVSRLGDIAPLGIRVTDGRLTFVDLSKVFNTDAVASEAVPSDGDLDGAGGTFPAESFPPDSFGLGANPEPTPTRKPDAPKVPTGTLERKPKPPKPLPEPVYQSGYYADFSPSARRVAFRYGAKSDGAKNAVTCANQVITVPKGNYGGAHFAITATGGQTQTVPVVLTYADKTTQTVSVTVRDWNEPQAPTGDTIAVMTRRKRTAKGDAPTACYVRHAIVPCDIAKELVSVTLPDNAKVAVFALTLDK